MVNEPQTTQLNRALFLIRLGLAIVFIFHGYGKLFGGAPGMDAFSGMVGKMGFPLPMLFAYAAALSEFLGGIAMLLGLWTKVFAGLITVVMLVAFGLVKKFHLPAADPDLALLCMSLAILVAGPGEYTIEKLFKKQLQTARTTS